MNTIVKSNQTNIKNKYQQTKHKNKISIQFKYNTAYNHKHKTYNKRITHHILSTFSNRSSKKLKKTKRRSRRISLREKRSDYYKHLRSLPILQTTPEIRRQHSISCSQYHTSKLCNKWYNFTADTNLHHWANLERALKQTPSRSYFTRMKNLTFHNLCANSNIPVGTKQLLGLGPKFIPKTAHPHAHISETLSAFSRDVRLKYLFAGTNPEPLTLNQRKIYLKSSFSPDPGNSALEKRLSNFNKSIANLLTIKTKNYKRSSNLSPIQLNTIKELKKQKNIVTLLADKNLGPVLLDRSTYIERVLNEHLLDSTTYEQLCPTTAKRQLDDIHDQLISLFDNPYSTLQNSLLPYEQTYFKRALHHTKHRIPTFYGLVKIHKSPWKLRPVVSCCGSLLAKISSWIDYHLQSIRTNIPSYIKDSEDLQNQLQRLHIPHNTRIFTCDAISMYTNIDIDHSIEIVTKWFDKYKNETPSTLPPKLLIAALTIVMKNNIFTFSDTFWLQKKGTAMGTPCACMIASLYFGFHERELILQKYKKNILFYKRFIDDVICLWIPSTSIDPNSDPTYKQLQTDMNSFGHLQWEFEPLSTSTTFLDLHISLIHNNPTSPTLNTTPSLPISPLTIQFKTHQKELNLYLYIPPHSAHPPGTLRSLIHGLLRKYWIQNTNPSDFRRITQLLFQRLCDRGHDPRHLLPLFTQAAHSIDSKLRSIPFNNTTSPSNASEIFLKWRFHPDSISRQTIRRCYASTCETQSPDAPLGFRRLPTKHGHILHIDKLTIAYTRDRNLRDILIPSKLPPLYKQNASDYLQSLPNHP